MRAQVSCIYTFVKQFNKVAQRSFVHVIVILKFCRCLVPPISLLTPILEYGRCFLRHPYEHHVKLQNESSLRAMYDLVPQNSEGNGFLITYNSPQPRVNNIT